jgi:putative SOS response-associated peptidase YedK
MCYSAVIWADYRKYVRSFGADIGIEEFFRTFWIRAADGKLKLPKAMEAAFGEPRNEDERRIKALIDEHAQAETRRLEQELFKQRTRLAEAERMLAVKETKAAAESKRIAGDKIEWSLGKLADLRRQDLQDQDARIFPGHYAPVMVMEEGRRVVKPMRYQCRPAGKPAFYDTKFPGTYNARRDSLGGFWKDLFGFRHGIMVVNAFYEIVSRHRMERRELRPGERDENVVLEFRPNPPEQMLVACLWSHWSMPGQPDLLSFAAITDDPPEEVAAAGHDRCIVPIKPEHIDEWLNPDPRQLDRQYEILDDRQRPFYEHRLAA